MEGIPQIDSGLCKIVHRSILLLLVTYCVKYIHKCSGAYIRVHVISAQN